MLRSFHSKLVAVLVGFAVVMALLFVAFIRTTDIARGQEINQKLYRTLASQLLADGILPGAPALDIKAAQEAFNRVRVANPRIDFYVLDPDGAILLSSTLTDVQRQAIDLAPVRAFLQENAKLPILGTDPTDESGQRPFSVAPVVRDGRTAGYLYLVLRGISGDTLAERIKNSYVLRDSLLFLASSLVLALLASVLIVKLMTRPLRQLTAVMDRFRQGGFATHPDQPHSAGQGPGDEIDRLTRNFNQMADHILRQMQELQETDRTRRELVANVSHDLRTPLAALQGYLETLQLKGATLTDREKRDYLDIALKQSRHLGVLVGKLFELARLDADPEIAPEPFNLGDLVQDIVQQFELAAANRGVALEVNVPENLPLVVADVGLIERVLKNLIDNALRYTPPGGKARVSAAGAEGRVAVHVSDTGSGIAADDLPHIFDRFYRGEKSRLDSSDNAGLGLAIVKRILELHGSSVAATSHPGMTVISFTLACAGAADPPAIGLPDDARPAVAK
jgi:signal transduction histidine kinase